MVDFPLHHGDILRFGVNVDRGEGTLLSSLCLVQSNSVTDVFAALQSRFEVEWNKPDVVVIPDDPVVPKTNLSPSTNTFTVPDDEDESDAEYDVESDAEIDDQNVDHPSDDSKESVARSLESAAAQPAEASSVSSVDKGEALEPKVELQPESKLEPKLEFKPYPAPIDNLSSVVGVSFGVLSPSGPNVSDPVKKLPYDPTETPPPDIKPLPIPTTASLETKTQQTDTDSLPFNIKPSSSSQTDKFPETCYQKVPEDAYSDWTMMRPMFMRLADMAWGESDQIPDVDYEKRIIHAARRCSLSRESYWVDDSPSFQPWAGTEIMWTPDSNASDTSFHRMPGNSLKYWAVDKRRYWIIYEDEDGMDMSNWWWIVEKPWGILSDEIKEQLTNEIEIDDCHKCWFVRAWEPQLIGNTWCESPPYWDSNFDEQLPSDDDSVDSDEGDQDQDFEDDPENMGDSAASEMEDCPFFNFNDESHGCNSEEYSNSEEDSEVDDASEVSECVSDVMDEEGDDSEKEEEHLIEWSSEASEESTSDDDSESSADLEVEPITPPKPVSVTIPSPEQTTVPVKRCRFVNNEMKVPGVKMVEARRCEEQTMKLLNEVRNSKEKCQQPGQIPPDLRGPPQALWPISSVPPMTNPGARFPNHAVSDELPRACRDQVLHPNPESSTIPVTRAYQDGPFAINTNLSSQDSSLPSGPAPKPGILKRTASDMESSSVLPESDLSQDAQRVPVDPVSQPDLQPISTEIQDAITSALAENDRPAKRVKSNHSPSRSLASHATTAVVGALLGGLGTIAMLAALPNEYFQ